MTPAFPKPTRAPKPRHGLTRSPMRRGKSKTKHGRRVREWGRMAYMKTQPCDVRAAFIATFGDEMRARFMVVSGSMFPGPCHGVTEVMHLREQASQHRADDSRTAPGCRKHHLQIDGDLGGCGPWYVALGREGQKALRERLVQRATLRWLTLTGNERADWDARARRGA
jgi:hypothetical protein